MGLKILYVLFQGKAAGQRDVSLLILPAVGELLPAGSGQELGGGRRSMRPGACCSHTCSSCVITCPAAASLLHHTCTADKAEPKYGEKPNWGEIKLFMYGFLFFS